MGRKRTDPKWRDRVYQTLAKNPDMSGVAIRLKLIRESDGARAKIPSDRKIRDLMKDYRNEPEEVQQQHHLFSWPESMESGALPWEASRAVLDLIAYIHDEAQDGYRPPLIGLVREFWKATQAAPDADVQTRLEIAAHLIFKKAEGLERYLAHRGWLKGEKLPPLCFTEEELWRGDTFDILASAYRMSPATRREAAEKQTEKQTKKGAKQ